MLNKLKNKVVAKVAQSKRNKEKKKQTQTPNVKYGENDDFGFMDELDSHETYTVSNNQPEESKSTAAKIPT